MAAAAGSWIPPTLPSDGLSDAAGCVLLDMRCYIANRPNATTAEGFTSRGLPIELTFHAARPPVLSHLSVHCPGMDFPGSAPKVVATHADLVLLRVPINPDACTEPWDYFVYRAAQPPLLHLLPNPYPKRFNDSEAAVLSRDGGGYVVAALRSRVPRRDPNSGEMVRNEFDLHLYRSDVADEGWVSKRLSVAEPMRDKLVPLPEAPDFLMYHESGKAITIGGKRGTVAWVDLWRGVILCDVLGDECPVLRDVPLPPPSMGNWNYLLQDCSPNFLRDVTVSRSKDSIKYVEMEIQPLKQSSDGWKATMWSMPIPVGSWEDWRRDCEVDVDEVVVEGVEPWLAKLQGGGTEATLQGLSMMYPTISMDDEVCFLSKVGKLEMVIAIDVREKSLRGVAELDSQKNFRLMPSYCSSEISLHLKEITGTIEPLKSTGKEKVEPKTTDVRAKELTRRGRGKKHVWRRVPLSDAVQFQVV